MIVNKILRKIKSRLQYRLIFWIVTVTVLLFSVVVGLTYNMYSENIQKMYVSDSHAMLNQLSIRTEEYFNSLEDISFSLYADMLFLPEYYVDKNTARVNNYRVAKLQSMYLQRKESHSIILYIPQEQEAYIINKRIGQSFIEAKDLEEKEWYQELTAGEQDVMIEPTHTLELYKERYSLNDEIPVFSINRYIQDQTVIPMLLSVNYTTEALQDMIQSAMVSDQAEIILLTENGEIFCKSNQKNYQYEPELFSKIKDSEQMQGELKIRDSQTHDSLMVLYKKSSFNNNLLLQIIDMKVILAQANSLRNTILLFSLIVIIILILFIFRISIHITRPLKEIEACMLEVGKGNFDSTLAINSQDEMGHISETFNGMTSQINQFISEKYLLNIKLKNAQLKTLRAQINPHFLYNTLQAIQDAASDAGVTEIEDIILALSRIFRYTIKSGGNIVTLAQEFVNVKSYLEIQKFRFEDHLNYHIEIPEVLHQLKVPKLILQPIVENAIVHGTQESERPGEIFLEAKLEGNTCIITVIDNGVGMEADLLEKIQERFLSYEIEGEEETEQIGLYNVYSRLVMMFEREFKMWVQMNEMGGIKVELRIPVQVDL